MIESATIRAYDGDVASPSIELLSALMRAHEAVLDQVEMDLEGALGLPLAWHEVLVRLARAPDGRLRMAELARSVLLTKSGFTRLADRMEEAGLIARAACPTDRRGTFALITEEGQATLARSDPVVTDAVERRLGNHLTAAERAVLRRALDKLAVANAG
jgi:DNA-binding MarR family transcriptional regulator